MLNSIYSGRKFGTPTAIPTAVLETPVPNGVFNKEFESLISLDTVYDPN